jgi:hypothetical protein
MRVFARRERPHPGAQLTFFEAGDGWRYAQGNKHSHGTRHDRFAARAGDRNAFMLPNAG